MLTLTRKKIGDEAVVVVDGPGVACPEEGEIQENNNVEEDQRG